MDLTVMLCNGAWEVSSHEYYGLQVGFKYILKLIARALTEEKKTSGKKKWKKVGLHKF